MKHRRDQDEPLRTDQRDRMLAACIGIALVALALVIYCLL